LKYDVVVSRLSWRFDGDAVGESGSGTDSVGTGGTGVTGVTGTEEVNVGRTGTLGGSGDPGRDCNERIKVFLRLLLLFGELFLALTDLF